MDSETTDIHYNGQKTPCVYECQHQSMKNTTIPWDEKTKTKKKHPV